jgi:hypothetical protein
MLHFSESVWAEKLSVFGPIFCLRLHYKSSILFMWSSPSQPTVAKNVISGSTAAFLTLELCYP